MRKTLIYCMLTGLFYSALSGESSLPIPPLLEGEEITLTVQQGTLALPFGDSDTLGYNGDYLGPTLRFSEGDSFNVLVDNTLNEDTTVHWHGMHIPAEFDGGPRQVVSAGGTWNPRFTIRQDAATLWYHPHLMGKTAEQVYRGLAGLIYIEDEFSRSLNIPREYGVNDIPLVLQDRRIDRDGRFRFAPAMADIMHGYTGNALLVNGAYKPELEIAGGTVRFRILNGSNSSIYRVRFSDGRKFTVIASDGGFLPETVSTDNLVLTSGERYEILVDLEKNEKVSLLTDIYGSDTHTAMTVDTDRSRPVLYEHPGRLRPFSIPGEETPAETRTFLMQTMGMMGFAINGKSMSMDRIDETIRLDTTEHWIVENRRTGMMAFPHSFHVHDVQFRILSLNGEAPPPLLSGPKDTILLYPGDTYRLALRFRDYEGIYMYHCHFLEHEDSGMMGQFEIIP